MTHPTPIPREDRGWYVLYLIFWIFKAGLNLFDNALLDDHRLPERYRFKLARLIIIAVLLTILASVALTPIGGVVVYLLYGRYYLRHYDF